MGLVSEVVADESTLARALELATEIARLPLWRWRRSRRWSWPVPTCRWTVPWPWNARRSSCCSTRRTRRKACTPSWRNARRTTREIDDARYSLYRRGRYRCDGHRDRPDRRPGRPDCVAVRQPRRGRRRGTPAPAANLRESMRQRQAERRRRRGRAKPAAGGGTPGTTGRLRTGGGGHRRAPGGQAGIAAPAGSHSRAGDHPRQQYLVVVDHRHRRRLRAAAAGRRLSLLQPGAADARGRGGRRPGQRSGSRRRPARPRRAPGPPRCTDQDSPGFIVNHAGRAWHRGPAHPRRRRRRMRRD